MKLKSATALVVVVLDDSGKALWTWAGDRDGSADSDLVGFDDCGGLLVAGRFQRTLIRNRVESPPSGARDAFLLRFEATGKLRWTLQLGGPGAQSLTAAALTRDGSIVVLGHSDSGALSVGASQYRFGDDAMEFVAEVTDSGDVQSVKRLARRAEQRFSAAVSRPGGDTVMVGTSGPLGDTEELLLRKLEVGGELGWQRVYGGRDWGSRFPSGVAVSPRGTLAVAATLSGSIRLGKQLLRSSGWDARRASRQIPPTDVLVGVFNDRGDPVRAWLLGDDSWQEARAIEWVEPNWSIVVGTFEDAIPLDRGRTLRSAGGRDAFAVALCVE